VLTPAYSTDSVTVYRAEALAALCQMPDASVDAIVTDPPAGISFMGTVWDTFGQNDHERKALRALGVKVDRKRFIAWLAEIMAETLRVAKPGALGLVWAIPRTAHWTAWALEEAGWEIHPNGFVAHHFASGFPKAKTHLKPATEVWWLVRKPGPGGLNIDDCRIEGARPPCPQPDWSAARRQGTQDKVGVKTHDLATYRNGEMSVGDTRGRWPTNLVLSHADGCVPVGTRKVRGDGRLGGGGTRPGGFGDVGSASGNGHPAGPLYGDSEEAVWQCVEGCPVAELDRQSGTLTSGFMAAGTEREGLGYRGRLGSRVRNDTIGDSGGASRFFYVAKASASERGAGLPPGERNRHPTVKPIKLMRWLCRLVTPPGGTVLDMFAGSGTTGCAAVLEGLDFVGIEQDDASGSTAIARIRYWAQHGHQQGLELEEEAIPLAGRVEGLIALPRVRAD
jgi:site-specific DNA-methyltransferase (adenine-specific)